MRRAEKQCLSTGSLGPQVFLPGKPVWKCLRCVQGPHRKLLMDLLWYLQALCVSHSFNLFQNVVIPFLFPALMESSGVQGTVTRDPERLLFLSGLMSVTGTPASKRQPPEELCLSDEPLGAAEKDVLEVGEIPEVGHRPASAHCGRVRHAGICSGGVAEAAGWSERGGDQGPFYAQGGDR